MTAIIKTYDTLLFKALNDIEELKILTENTIMTFFYVQENNPIKNELKYLESQLLSLKPHIESIRDQILSILCKLEQKSNDKLEIQLEQFIFQNRASVLLKNIGVIRANIHKIIELNSSLKNEIFLESDIHKNNKLILSHTEENLKIIENQALDILTNTNDLLKVIKRANDSDSDSDNDGNISNYLLMIATVILVSTFCASITFAVGCCIMAILGMNDVTALNFIWPAVVAVAANTAFLLSAAIILINYQEGKETKKIPKIIPSFYEKKKEKIDPAQQIKEYQKNREDLLGSKYLLGL